MCISVLSTFFIHGMFVVSPLCPRVRLLLAVRKPRFSLVSVTRFVVTFSTVPQQIRDWLEGVVVVCTVQFVARFTVVGSFTDVPARDPRQLAGVATMSPC